MQTRGRNIDFKKLSEGQTEEENKRKLRKASKCYVYENKFNVERLICKRKDGLVSKNLLSYLLNSIWGICLSTNGYSNGDVLEFAQIL